eukprot:571776_1
MEFLGCVNVYVNNDIMQPWALCSIYSTVIPIAINNKRTCVYISFHLNTSCTILLCVLLKATRLFEQADRSKVALCSCLVCDNISPVEHNQTAHIGHARLIFPIKILYRIETRNRDNNNPDHDQTTVSNTRNSTRQTYERYSMNDDDQYRCWHHTNSVVSCVYICL